MIDHTQLKPEASARDIIRLCEEAVEFGCASVCVNPSRVRLAASRLETTALPVCAVLGFPLGALHPGGKIEEARRTHHLGAREFDMVINLGAVMDGNLADAAAEIDGVRKAVEGNILKVIIESAVLTDDQIRSVCRVAVQAGADYVKTSTGLHPAGGATVHAVRRMRDAIGTAVGVKASGGIRSAQIALAMCDAGATRLGVSATGPILAEID